MVAAVISLYGPLDLVDLARNSREVPPQIREAFIGSLFGDLASAFLRTWSPAAHVRPDAPPFLLIHGTADPIVPYHQPVQMHRRVQEVGARGELITVEGGGHGVRGWQRRSDAPWLKQMVAWLQRQVNREAGAASTVLDRKY